MGSPRPICKSVWLSASVWPPSWRMATSKDTRVRVEGFSKISISTASSMPAGLQLRRHALAGLLHGVAHVDDAPAACRRRCESISRKCRGGMAAATPVRGTRPAQAAGLATRLRARDSRCTASRDLGFGDVERRQQAHDVLAGADRQQLLGHAGGDHLAHRRLDLDAGQQAAAAHLLDHVGVLVLDARQLLLEAQRHGAAPGRGSPAPARHRAPRCRPPWPAGCRRRWSRACRAPCPWPPPRWP